MKLDIICCLHGLGCCLKRSLAISLSRDTSHQLRVQKPGSCPRVRDPRSCLAILAILHLGLLRISPQHRCIMQTSCKSVVFFLPSFVVIYSLNETYIFFILVFSYPILLYLFLFLSSTSPCLSPLSFFVYHPLSHSPSVSFFVSLLLSFFVSLLLSFFACLPLYFPYSFLFLFLCVFFYFPVLIFCILYVSISCLPFPLIFLSFYFFTLYFFMLSLIILF